MSFSFTRSQRRVLDAPLFLCVVVAASLPPLTSPRQSAQEPRGLHGYVLRPDGAPVSGGTVTTQSREERVTAAIDSSGRFRVVASDGLRELHVSVPGLAPYRVAVTAPPSASVALPVITLSPATFFRAQLLSPSGEPVASGDRDCSPPQLELRAARHHSGARAGHRTADS